MSALERGDAARSNAGMLRRPSVRWLLAPCLVLACADAEPSATEADDTSATTTAGTSSTGMSGSTTTTTADDTTLTTTEPATSSSSTAPTDSSSSTTGGDTVTLQNDGWTPTDGLTWQTWPSPGDCWASTYAIDASLYPFDVVAVEAAIGGADEVRSFEVGIWELDGDGLPAQAIDTTTVEIEGNVQGPPIDIEGALTIPTITEGGFAVVMCHVDHMGAPSIAIDVDGTVDGEHNFAYQSIDGDWVSSPDFFGTSGDFVLRAIVRPI